MSLSRRKKNRKTLFPLGSLFVPSLYKYSKHISYDSSRAIGRPFKVEIETELLCGPAKAQPQIIQDTTSNHGGHRSEETSPSYSLTTHTAVRLFDISWQARPLHHRSSPTTSLGSETLFFVHATYPAPGPDKVHQLHVFSQAHFHLHNKLKHERIRHMPVSS